MTLGQAKLDAAGQLARIYFYLAPDIRPNGWTDRDWYARQRAAVMLLNAFDDVGAAMYDFRVPAPESTFKSRPQNDQGDWHPANNGTETPFVSRSGRRLLYCYQMSSGRHAYLDMSRDVILTDDEAQAALGMN